MSIWQLLKKWRMASQQKKKYHFVLGEPLTFHPSNTASQEPDKLNLHSQAVSPPNPKTNYLYQHWILLSPREQDITALTCLRYTDRQIAARLGLSKATVRTYVEKVLLKLNLQSKPDLRVTFASWDFSEWERRDHHR